MVEPRWRTIRGEGLHLEYCPNFIQSRRADELLKCLEQDLEYFTGELSKVKVFGKWHDIPRQQVAFGDEGLKYKYSGLSVHALPWPKPLLDLRKEIAERIGQDYNFVLVNRYRDGKDYIGEHRDDEAELDKVAGIASISLGAVRDFVLRHGDTRRRKRDIRPVKIPLAHGSCLLMKQPTNTHWYHSLPKRTSCKTVRVNLTFRRVERAS